MSQALSSAPVLYHDRVRSEWVDYNGHLSEAYYVLVFGHTTDAFYDLIGMDDAYRRRTARSVYTLESHISYLHEVGEGEGLEVSTQVLGADSKRVHLFHTMHHGEQGHVLATSELMLLHVDTTVPHAIPFAPEIQARLGEIAKAHADLPRPKQAGRSIGL
ncbi:MAG: thioesterase family protein [Acidiferrobacterales bacterium]